MAQMVETLFVCWQIDFCSFVETRQCFIFPTQFPTDFKDPIQNHILILIFITITKEVKLVPTVAMNSHPYTHC